jgi:protein O-GlcNAc transferase
LSQFQPAQEALARAHKLSPGILSELLPNLEQKPAPADIGHFTEPAFLATSLFLAANLKAQEDCNWLRRDNFLNVLESSIENGLPHGGQLHDKRLAQPLLSMPLPPEMRLKAMRNISRRVAETAHAHKLPPFTHLPRHSGRIRIGYVSPDFRDHSVGYLSKPIYRLHDRSRFEIHCYSLRNAPEDATQKDIAAACDHWHDLSVSDSVSAARRIHADKIDILIDMAGYTRDANLEIFAFRPAPIQAHFLGYPGTLGADFLDYVIADQVVCPETYKPYVSEKPMLLPNTYCPYDTGTPNGLTAIKRIDIGLPESGFVFCCFNAGYKIEPTVFELWLNLLQQAPDSVLWLVSQHQAERNNLKRQAERHGIAPERLVFAPYMSRERYLSSFQLADLFLDTRWHNAHTIAADALWQGLPVLTCAGPHWSSRLGASLLHAVGMPELITSSLEEYEHLALDLASNRERLRDIRKKLLGNRDSAPLFSPEKTVRNLEQALETMWRRWLKQFGAE